MGQNSSFAPDYAEGKVSAKRMFALFDSKIKIDAYSDGGHKPVRIYQYVLLIVLMVLCLIVDLRCNE